MNYKEIASEVLVYYPISNPEIEYIRHNENMTFKVTDSLNNKKYLLRVHKPVTEGLAGIQHSYEGLKSEMELLNALNGNMELLVQKPVLNCEREYVTEYSNSSLGRCYATLLEWIDGNMINPKEDASDEIAFLIGEKLGVLHNLIREFKQSQGFKRPIYGVKKIDEAIEKLKYGIEINLFTKEHYDIMREVLLVVKGRLEVLEAKEGEWGIIHADAIPGNIIINNGQPFFIDFCLSGFGYYLFDVGSVATIFDEKHLREEVLRGYASKTKFSYDSIKDIESLVFMDIFVSYTFFIRDEKKNGWIKDHAAKLCDTTCKEFLEGKEVLFSI